MGWVSHYNCEGPVKNPSIWKECLSWIVSLIRSARGETLEGWRTDRRPWGVGDDGRIGNLLKQDSMRKRWYSPKENLFSNRRWKNQNTLRRLRLENTHFNTGPPNSRRRSRRFLGESEGSLPQSHNSFPDAVKRWMICGPCREASYTAITLNPESNFTRRKKNHSLFHWSTLTSPELLIRIWMSRKRSALMIIGTLMGLEICQIFGQVSHNLLFWVGGTSRRIYVVRAGG